MFEKLDAPKVDKSAAKSNRNSLSHLKSPRGYAQQNALGDQNWSLKATYVEIYNEQLRDLLVSDTTSTGERSNVAIREDTKGNIILTGLQQVEINSVEDLMSALEFGSSIRQTDATAINAKSSRSHAVFSLNLVQRKKSGTSAAERRFSVPIESMSGNETSVTTDSKLHFVDLAGSERLKNTGAHGDRAKEGISINAGLAALGKVISQLSSRQSGSHVSYRDSKLTRLLQDSLGGNAITYMIACVTPAEFHLSETLNTVQYAQRARAIQSKPRIQQVEEGDKQAIIDRLKAEVAFLREQISNNANRDGGSPRRPPGGERADRSNEREADLQNQLLDQQENYNALSERHAKLIAEMAKARENESSADHTDGDSATDRLNRSNSFAQAVEQVVLEYETTIQSLEQSISSTRGILSTTEASLLEKETKCAYIETINSQLQARLQKLMDREANTETYLNDLESKLDGHTTGDEKNTAIISELRKEISRSRDNEASCEEYISTLEERLAEADQDAELMQREVDRLEQVVERQRSLGKLDSLLHELDEVQEAKQPETVMNGSSRRRSGTAGHSRVQSHVSRHSQIEDPIPEGDEDGEPKFETVKEEAEEDGLQPAADIQYGSQSPAQTKYVADKLENVTQELIGLRVEHETTVNQYDILHAEYEKALRTISELRDSVDEARHRDTKNRDSMISDSVASETETKAGHLSTSRSLSSELSDIDSPTTAVTSNGDISEDDAATTKAGASTENLSETDAKELEAEIKRLQTLAEEKEAAEKELVERYAQLETKHSETLDMVEDLKTEVSRAKSAEATRAPSSGIIRRKSSQNLLMIDRAHRSFSSLRNIANDYLAGNTEVMQSFEINLTSAMHELHTRTERISELETEVATAKKEMETKMTIISGLTRERNSLKTGPTEMSMVATLRDQLEQNERQLSDMREAHAAREHELQTEIETLKGMEPGSLAAVDTEAKSVEPDVKSDANSDEVDKLKAELSEWEHKHQSVLGEMEKADKEMCAQIQTLEAELGAASAKLAEAQADTTTEKDAAATEAAQKQEELVKVLRNEVDEYKAIINSNAARVAELETTHSAAKTEQESAKSEVEEANKAREAAAAQTAEIMAELEKLQQMNTSQLEELELLKKTHAQEVTELKAQEQKGYEEQVEVLMSEQAESIQKLESELTVSKEELLKVATQVATALGVEASIEKIEEHIKALDEARIKSSAMEASVAELTAINDEVMKDLEAAKVALADLVPKSDGSRTSVIEQVTAVKSKLSDLEGRNSKNSRLVEELEEQLQNNFDEAQATNNRLSSLQSERNSQIEEAAASRIKIQVELESIREEYATLQVSFINLVHIESSEPVLTKHQAKYDEVANVQRSNSNSNTMVRKSASHTSLPSPPPAVPLPPLPNGASSPNMSTPGSPTGGRPPSKQDLNISQVTEDQEARIRTIEKHLYAERQLTQTLEEALTDLEKQSNKVKADCDAWKKRASELESEVRDLKDKTPSEPQQDNRWSLQAVEEERKKRQAAEAAKRQLEDRMNAINKGKKKKGSLNCF